MKMVTKVFAFLILALFVLALAEVYGGMGRTAVIIVIVLLLNSIVFILMYYAIVWLAGGICAVVHIVSDKNPDRM